MSKNSPMPVSDVVAFLNNLTRRNKVFRAMPIQLLRILNADSRRVLEQREDEEMALEAEQRARQKMIDEHLSLLKKDGIEPDELLNNGRPLKRPSIGRVRHYRIKGELISYKGVGKYPRKLKDIVEQEGEEGLKNYEISND
ncbi:hypothetical protein [Serratia proteamaculans]|uniref:H-NS family histone-like protein n=1 Tax=Serratia proteamaculans TaxID=28151 RepID=UPI003D043CD1